MIGGIRSQRRRDIRRMKQKAIRTYPDCPEWAVKKANHLATCSKWCCGHQRKWFGPTRQELKAVCDGSR